MKGQLGIEYLMVYAFSLAAIGYVLSVFNVVGLGVGSSAGMSTPIPSSCYITAQLSCAGMSMNGRTGNIIVIFSNGAGAGLLFPSNSFKVESGGYYVGSCVAQIPPSQGPTTPNSTDVVSGNDNGNGNNCHNNGNGDGNAPTNHCNLNNGGSNTNNSMAYSNYSRPGTSVVCTAQADGKSFSQGAQANPTFSIGYKICQRASSCQQELNTTGTATVYIS